MACLLIPVVVAFLAWANFATVRMFQARAAGPGWWAMVSLLWAGGVALGIWGGFFFEYQPSSRLRVIGAPVPGAFFHLEGPPGEEQWVDFITPEPLLFAGSNVLLMPLLLASPIGLVFRLWAGSARHAEGRGSARR